MVTISLLFPGDRELAGTALRCRGIARPTRAEATVEMLTKRAHVTSKANKVYDRCRAWSSFADASS
jgi:hypothetical protein